VSHVEDEFHHLEGEQGEVFTRWLAMLRKLNFTPMLLVGYSIDKGEPSFMVPGSPDRPVDKGRLITAVQHALRELQAASSDWRPNG
jgi:hypothetical protein